MTQTAHLASDGCLTHGNCAGDPLSPPWGEQAAPSLTNPAAHWSKWKQLGEGGGERGRAGSLSDCRPALGASQGILALATGAPITLPLKSLGVHFPFVSRSAQP